MDSWRPLDAGRSKRHFDGRSCRFAAEFRPDAGGSRWFVSNQHTVCESGAGRSGRGGRLGEEVGGDDGILMVAKQAPSLLAST
jgi:hypothetical protein